MLPILAVLAVFIIAGVLVERSTKRGQKESHINAAGKIPVHGTKPTER